MKIIAKGSKRIVLSANLKSPFNKKLTYNSDKSPKIAMTNPLNSLSVTDNVLLFI